MVTTRTARAQTCVICVSVNTVIKITGGAGGGENFGFVWEFEVCRRGKICFACEPSADVSCPQSKQGPAACHYGKTVVWIEIRHFHTNPIIYDPNAAKFL